MVGTLLKRFTMLPMEEITRLEALQGQDINEAKKILAFEATKLCHGEDAATEAENTAQKVFEQGSVGDDLPSVEINEKTLEQGVPILDLFVQAGLAASKGGAPFGQRRRRKTKRQQNRRYRSRRHQCGPDPGRLHQTLRREKAPRACQSVS